MIAEKSREGELLGLLIKAKVSEAELNSDKLFDMVFGWRIHEKNPAFMSDHEYIQANKDEDEVYEKLKRIIKDDRATWDVISKLDEAHGTKLAISNAYSYKTGIQDGIALLLNILKIGSV